MCGPARTAPSPGLPAGYRTSPAPCASQTPNYNVALGEAFDVESEVYCRRRSGNFWRMRASLGLVCAQATTLGTHVIGRPRSRPRGAPSSGHGSLPAPQMAAAFSSLFSFFALSACACRFEVTLQSLRLNTPRVSHRGILNTNQRLSQHRWPPAPDHETAANFQRSML